MELWRLLAHNHWFELEIHGYKIRLCARCSGYATGLIFAFLILYFLRIEPLTLLGNFWLLVSLFLALPLIVDWLTQSWGLRNGSNEIRFISGLILGIDLFIFMCLGLNQLLKIQIFVTTALITAIIGALGKLYVSRQYIKSIN
jgi:uncharacterized membrane protein